MEVRFIKLVFLLLTFSYTSCDNKQFTDDELELVKGRSLNTLFNQLRGLVVKQKNSSSDKEVRNLMDNIRQIENANENIIGRIRVTHGKLADTNGTGLELRLSIFSRVEDKHNTGKDEEKIASEKHSNFTSEDKGDLLHHRSSENEKVITGPNQTLNTDQNERLMTIQEEDLAKALIEIPGSKYLDGQTNKTKLEEDKTTEEEQEEFDNTDSDKQNKHQQLEQNIINLEVEEGIKKGKVPNSQANTPELEEAPTGMDGEASEDFAPLCCYCCQY